MCVCVCVCVCVCDICIQERAWGILLWILGDAPFGLVCTRISRYVPHIHFQEGIQRPTSVAYFSLGTVGRGGRGEERKGAGGRGEGKRRGGGGVKGVRLMQTFWALLGLCSVL